MNFAAESFLKPIIFNHPMNSVLVCVYFCVYMCVCVHACVYCGFEGIIPPISQILLCIIFLCSLTRNQGYRVRNSYVLGKLGTPYSWEGNIDGLGAAPAISDRCISFERNKLATWQSSGLYISSHGLSSQAGAENSGEEDDLEDGFSELETPPSTSSLGDNKAADDNEESGTELEDDDDDDGTQNELDLPEVETELVEKISTKRAPSALFKAIFNAPGSVASALDKWVSEGKDLSRADISLAMLNLRRRRMFGKALQVI